MDSLKRNMDIIIILVVGFALRFSISISHSYSNDELSAINRLQYDNFSDLIEYGVKTGDMHPAGVQVFMKLWSQLAGVNETGMRFPFVLCGTISIFLIFLLGKKWINRQAGLTAAIFLSLLYFPILNSEFARPYAPGLMFCLLSAWFYLNILFDEKKKLKNGVLLGLALAASMYTHHFAFMFVGWMGISGAIFWNKNNFRYVLTGASLAILLYLPHLSITRYQMGVGGLGWLGPPDNDWLFQFLFYTFNDSWWVLGGVLLMSVATFFLKEKTELISSRFILLCMTWFFGIYIIGHVYSLYETPVLKYPVMLFALPFFFLPLGYLLSRFRYQTFLFSALMILLATSTLREKDLFGNKHYEIFKEIADDMVRWNKDYGSDNIYTVFNVNNPNYINFYAEQMGETIHFDWDVIEFWSADSLRNDLKSTAQDYCVVGYSGRLTKPEIFETCKEFFPGLLEYKKYNNSAVFLLSRKRPSQLTQEKARLSILGENNTAGWTVADHQLRLDSTNWVLHGSGNGDTLMKEYSKFFISDSINPYGPDYEFKLSQIENPYEKYIRVNISGFAKEYSQVTVYVNGFRNGEPLTYRGEPFWMGRDIEGLLRETQYAYFVFRIPDFVKADDVLRIGIWNRNPAEKVLLRSIEIEVYDNIWN